MVPPVPPVPPVPVVTPPVDRLDQRVDRGCGFDGVSARRERQARRRSGEAEAGGEAEWRRIDVRVKRPAALVRARIGYFGG